MSKTPFLCTKCNLIMLINKSTVDQYKSNYDVSFMVDLLAVFPRYDKDRTLDSYKMRYFCSLRIKAASIDKLVWPRLVIGGTSNDRSGHTCLRSLKPRDPLSKGEIKLEHLEIMRMFGFKPKKEDEYLEKMYSLQEVSTSTPDSNGSKRKRSLSECSEDLNAQKLDPSAYDRTFSKNELKEKYTEIEIELEGKR